MTVTDKPGPLTSALAKFLEEMKQSESKKNVVNPGCLFTEICKKYVYRIVGCFWMFTEKQLESFSEDRLFI